MKNINLAEKLFSWGSASLILLIPPLIWLFSSFIYCEMIICGMAMLVFLISFPVFYAAELIIFSLCIFLLNKLSSKKVKEYKIALVLSGIVMDALFFTPQLKAGAAYLTKNIVFCKMIDPKYEREGCISMIAAKTLNESFCNDPDANKKYCREGIGKRYYQLAKQKGDISLCEKANSYKGDCYYDFAMSTNNPVLCEKAVNPEYFARKRDFCYEKLANREKNINLCNKIRNTSIKEGCYESMDYIADLIIEDVNIRPSSPKIGDSLQFFIKVKNIGSKETRSFKVCVYTHSLREYALIDKLAPGEEKKVIISFNSESLKQAGLQIFTIEVDSENKIRESKEANDEIQKEIYIRAE